MHRVDAERLLTAIRAGQGRIASAMFTVDSHPGLGFLRSGGIRGRTQAAWASIGPDIDALWTEFNALNQQIDEVSAAPARRRSEAEAATLRATADLAASLEPRTAAVVGQLDTVNAAWTACGAAIVPVTDALAALTTLATGLGEAASVATLNQRGAAIRDALLSDPLTAAPLGALTDAAGADIGALTDAVAAASAGLTAQASVRDGFPARVTALESAIDGVRAEEARARAAFQRATEKINDTQLPPAPAAAEVLRARVIDLDKVRQRKQWHRLTDDVQALEASIARAQTRAAELRDAADGLLTRRDELRGRLQAYRAKAARHKVDEDEELATLHTAAHTLLYTAPCDLPDATRAVYAYQTAVTARTSAAPSQPTGSEDAR